MNPIDEKNRKQVELFDPQNEPDKSPSMWCVYILLVCAFAVLALIVAAAFALMAQSIETPAKAQEQQKPGWITYHYALPMILRESGGTTTPVPTTTSTVTTTSTTTSTTSTTTTLFENLEWETAEPRTLMLNGKSKHVEITGHGFLNDPAFGLKVHLGGMGSFVVAVRSSTEGSFDIPGDFLDLYGYWDGVPPAQLVSFLFTNYSDSEYFMIGLLKP